jgi:hypothetical protein
MTGIMLNPGDAGPVAPPFNFDKETKPCRSPKSTC